MMNDMNTYLLMTELCKRLSDHLYDPEPLHDHVFDDIAAEHIRLDDLHQCLLSKIVAYKDAVEKRIEDTGEFS